MKYLLIVMALYLGSVAGCNRGKANKMPEGLPSASLLNSKGETIDLAGFKGKKVFLNLWATWCGPCVSEMPSIQQLYNQTQHNNTEFVMISLDKSLDIAKQWADQRNYSLPIYFAPGDLPQELQVTGIPATFIFDETGKLIFSQIGSNEYDTPRFVKMLSDKAQP